jgi:hypothetical protein
MEARRLGAAFPVPGIEFSTFASTSGLHNLFIVNGWLQSTPDRKLDFQGLTPFLEYSGSAPLCPKI